MDFIARTYSLLERIKPIKNAIFFCILGVFFLIYGFYEFFNIQGFENTGQGVIRLHSTIRWIYDLFGKYGILFFHELSGVFFLFVAKKWTEKE